MNTHAKLLGRSCCHCWCECGDATRTGSSDGHRSLQRLVRKHKRSTRARENHEIRRAIERDADDL